MSWQEELRRLDADLASGKITQHQHRKQRDELLAAVSGGSAASPVVSPRQHSGQPVPPPSEPPRRNQWHATNPAPMPPARRQPPAPQPAPKQSHAQSLLSTDRPTTAPSPADVRRTESMPYPKKTREEQTVIHPAVRPPEPPRPPSRPALPGSPAATASNPFPMDDPAPSSRGRAKPTWAFLAIGVLVVLGLIIGGTIWLSSSGEQSPSAPPPAAGQEQATASLEDRLPPLPGTANAANSTMALDKGLELKLFDKAALDAMKANGAREVIYRGSSERTEGYMVLVVPTASPEGATNLVKALTAQSSSVGFQKSRSNADALARENDSGRVVASWYRSGDNVVGIGVSQTPQGDEAALAGKFGAVETALAGVLPKS